MTTQTIERSITAFLDGEDSIEIDNIIHSTEGAAQFGFSGALVGGVTVYSWAVPALIEALGEEWLDSGWIDFRLRRPVYPGDEITTRVVSTPPAPRGGDAEASHTLPSLERDAEASHTLPSLERDAEAPHPLPPLGGDAEAEGGRSLSSSPWPRSPARSASRVPPDWARRSSLAISRSPAIVTPFLQPTRRRC